jgi:HEAT repeat protein
VAPGPATEAPTEPDVAAAARPPARARPSPAALESGDYPRKVFRLQEIEQKVLREARGEVLEAFTGAPDSLTIASALSALKVVGTPEDLEEARRFLVHRNDRVRANAVEAVERLGTHDDILGQLAPMANDRDNRVRGNVLKALAPIEPESVLPHVEYLLSSPDDETRATALYVISALEGSAAEPLLTRAIEDPAVSIRRKAVPLLAKFRQPWCREALKRLAEDNDAALRNLAARELAAWPGPVAPPVLERAAAPAPAPERAAPPALQKPVAPPPRASAPPPPAPQETAPPAPATSEPGRAGEGEPAPPPDAKGGKRRSRAARAPAMPELPPLKAGGSMSSAPGLLSTPAEAAKEASTGSIDFKGFEPSRDAGSADAEPVSALGREMDSDSRENAPSRLMLCPELQGQLDELYDQLDEQLELIGRRICKALRSNLITEIDLMSLASPVKKYEAQLEAFNEEAARMGLLKALFSNREMESKKAQLVFQLSEAYRKVGEGAVEKAQTSGKRHADLQELHTKVDELFLAVRKLKEGKS